jgi:anhydro-N-acetylmuramic acid kinase
MARLTGLRVVNDFRRADVAQGGQGAPLVPVGDRLLFGAYGACLNLGGFANLSYEDAYGKRRAFDTGPANMALNHLASKLGQAFDDRGRLAAGGKVSAPLLEQMNQLEYFRMEGPKSLGKEWFTREFLPILEAAPLDIPDLLATTSEHIALQIGRALHRAKKDNVLVTGGGALNLNLLARIGLYYPGDLVIPSRELVSYKEALVFALLGILKIRGEVNCLASVTGGIRDLSCGILHQP